MKKQLALITGATAGIGLATAEALAGQGYDLIITGRREERLTKIAGDLSSKFGVRVVTAVFDVGVRAQCEAAFKKLASELPRLSVLVNNAGLALGTASLQSIDLDHVDQMVDTNIKGLLYVTRLCLPYMIANGDGHVVNIGSVAGRWTYPGGGVYAATKFAVRALSEALRLDLMGTPIRVTNIEPGMVETEFSEVRLGDEAKAAAVYKGMTPLKAVDIAESIVWCLARPKHVNIQELMIFPTDQAGVGPYVSRK